MKSKFAIFALAFFTNSGLNAQTLILNPDNGHYYEAISVPGGISWTEADRIASAKGGYLVTITSVQENQFVFQLINEDQYWFGTSGPWIGARQPTESQEPDGGWIWVNGEGLLGAGFTAWSTGEPNNALVYDQVGEMYAQFSVPLGQGRAGTWNDTVNYPVWMGHPVNIGFVVEYSSVPEQIHLSAIAGFGLSVFAVYRRRCRP